jgi:hypothetical protein
VNEEWNQAIEACVGRLLHRAGIRRPPIDAVELARRLGFVVAIDRRQEERARCARLSSVAAAPTAAIYLRPEPRPERRQWAVAHEIGEHSAQELFATLGIADDTASQGLREQSANTIANRLLLPSRWFFADGEAYDWDLGRLKERYAAASHELIARRMLEADAPAIVSIYDHGKLRFRGGNGGRRAPPPSPVEAAVQRRAHETGTFQLHHEETFRTRAWPIHEPDWKREIVRTDSLDDSS